MALTPDELKVLRKVKSFLAQVDASVTLPSGEQVESRDLAKQVREVVREHSRVPNDDALAYGAAKALTDLTARFQQARGGGPHEAFMADALERVLGNVDQDVAAEAVRRLSLRLRPRW